MIAFVLSVPAATHAGLATWLSLTASSCAFVLMTINIVLAGRHRLLEPAFDGLDRVYRHHRGIGIAAMALILLHYFITPSFDGSAVSRGQNELGSSLGKIAFYGIVAMILFSLLKRVPNTALEVPYQLWKPTHRLIGVLFVFAAGHQLIIKKPSGFSTSLLQGYLNLVGLAGVLFFAWTQVAPLLRSRAYTVGKVSPVTAGTDISLKPTGKPLRAHPGQFAFLKIERNGLREPHPFTIAGNDEDGALRFVIKPLGDYTRRLTETLAVGDRVWVEGGYGRFGRRSVADRQLWLAGGIGITPFLAMAERLDPARKEPIHLIHVVGNATEAVGRDSFEALADRRSNFRYTIHETSTRGRIDASKLVEMAGFDLNGADVLFCGPGPFRVTLMKGLAALNKRPRLHFERFEFR